MARPTIKLGSSGKKGTDVGEAILLWRLFLGKPELKPAANATQYDFGSATDKYTKAWQTSVGLKADGIVGPSTWAAYDARMAKAPPAVQAKAVAVETQGEANKAAAMAKAVAAKPTPKPTPAPKPATKPIATTAPVSATPLQRAKERVTSQVAAVKNKVVAKKETMAPWQRGLAAGFIAIGALIGIKALKR